MLIYFFTIDTVVSVGLSGKQMSRLIAKGRLILVMQYIRHSVSKSNNSNTPEKYLEDARRNSSDMMAML